MREETETKKEMLQKTVTGKNEEVKSEKEELSLAPEVYNIGPPCRKKKPIGRMKSKTKKKRTAF